MTQLFTLQLTDNVETIDFLSTTVKLLDGGFNIGLPKRNVVLAPRRAGFYVPTLNQYEYREGSIKFQIHGATEAAVLQTKTKLERILRRINAQSKLGGGRRGQLAFAWKGADSAAYFEVYSGDLVFPSDFMSVEKALAIINGKYVLPDCEFTFYLSGHGYGVSLYSNTLTEIPLYNPTELAKKTGGVRVTNPATGAYNYVEIDAADIPGSEPYLTRIHLDLEAPNAEWKYIYMGLQAAPFPTTLLFDDADLDYTVAGSSVVDANAMGGSYWSNLFNTVPYVSQYRDFVWNIGGNNTVGRFIPFHHGFANFPTNWQIAGEIGGGDYLSLSQLGSFTGLSFGNQKTIPLSMIQLPPGGQDLADLGTITEFFSLGYRLAGETAGTITIDYLSLLPVSGGLRVLTSRVSGVSLSGELVDDGWRGLEYYIQDNKYSNAFYGLLEPLSLEPAITQRIYFTSLGGSAANVERARTFFARLYAVPTFLTMPM